jgi:two-component system chemotaxis sensor kinase CheA
MEKKVLLIDEDEIYMMPIFDRLKFEKINYDYCNTGYKGLEKFKKEEYKLIILDMRLSLGEELENITNFKPPGLYVLEEIRKINKKIPIICFTIIDDESLAGNIKKLNSIYINKTEEIGFLFETIKKYI